MALNESEQLFVDKFDTYEVAGRIKDMIKHWDVKVPEYGKVDVKAQKKINRSDNILVNEIHWIEIKNVNGNSGWLYGEADYFAFQTDEGFLMVPKIPLQHFIAKKCSVDRDVYIKDKKPKLYRLYRRYNRRDVITMVETSELKELADSVI